MWMQIELSDPSKSLFFYYIHDLKPADFAHIKESQKLTCSWPEYLTVVQRLLMQTLREGTHFAILTKNQEAQTAKLWFIMVRGRRRKKLAPANLCCGRPAAAYHLAISQ